MDRYTPILMPYRSRDLYSIKRIEHLYHKKYAVNKAKISSCLKWTYGQSAIELLCFLICIRYHHAKYDI